MKLKETFFSKDYVLETQQPYHTALELKRLVKKLGKIVERKNLYETDGPYHKAEVSFDIVKDLDKFSRIILFVDINGKSSLLNPAASFLSIKVSFTLQTNITDRGFFTRTLSDYYVEKFFPEKRKEAEDKIHDLAQEIEIVTTRMAQKTRK